MWKKFFRNLDHFTFTLPTEFSPISVRNEALWRRMKTGMTQTRGLLYCERLVLSQQITTREEIYV
jgi:hypothetical protein